MTDRSRRGRQHGERDNGSLITSTGPRYRVMPDGEGKRVVKESKNSLKSASLCALHKSKSERAPKSKIGTGH